jgi:hypothetical protein
MLTTHNDVQARLFAGLFLRTPRQTRFWGWSSLGWNSLGWGSLRGSAPQPPLTSLGAWLRRAHAELDGVATNHSPETEDTQSLAQYSIVGGAEQSSRKHRRLQFVCNRRGIGLLIR